MSKVEQKVSQRAEAEKRERPRYPNLAKCEIKNRWVMQARKLLALQHKYEGEKR